MVLNAIGRKFIQDQEGCRLEAYQDQGGVWTIGYGCTHGVEQGMRITQQQADDLFLVQVRPFERGVSSIVLIPLSPNEFAAIVSLAYNVGLASVRNSNLIRELNSGNLAAAAKEFLRGWDTVDGVFDEGLANRRKREMELFLSGATNPQVA